MNSGSRGRSAHAASATLLALLLAAGLPLGAAERLHLDSGGHIDVDRYWISGPTLLYEAASGTVGIPRSMVVRIEPLPTAPRPAAVPEREPTAASGAALPSDDKLRERLRDAHAALERREFEEAAAGFLALLDRHPELYTARVGYAVSQIGLDHDGLALSAVLDGISRDPDRPELYVLLGQLRYREDRIDDARRAFGRAFELSPTDELRDLLIKIERELHASRSYDLSSSAHFNLRYDGSVDLDLARAMLDYLEAQYWVVTDLLRHTPAQPISVQLLTREQFRDVTQAPEWAGGIYDGKIRLPLGGLSRLTPDAERVLVHELAHAVIHSKSRGTAPRWLHEGLAQMAEGKKVLRSELVAMAKELAGVPSERLGDLPFSYPRSLSLVQYLAARSGFDSLVDVLDRLGRGTDLERSLREVYGQDYASLAQAWARTLEQERER